MWAPLVSPWPEATVGGIVAANFNAPLRMRYGSIRDLVLAASVALPMDGSSGRGGPCEERGGLRPGQALRGRVGHASGLLTDVSLKLAPAAAVRAPA